MDLSLAFAHDVEAYYWDVRLRRLVLVNQLAKDMLESRTACGEGGAADETKSEVYARLVTTEDRQAALDAAQEYPVAVYGPSPEKHRMATSPSPGPKIPEKSSQKNPQRQTRLTALGIIIPSQSRHILEAPEVGPKRPPTDPGHPDCSDAARTELSKAAFRLLRAFEHTVKMHESEFKMNDKQRDEDLRYYRETCQTRRQLKLLAEPAPIRDANESEQDWRVLSRF
ncbi:hypothetical protein N656DRAFT_842683 [Canariomyces notabilis]|uniref:Uncharacterized protein n=1 Tax=Canariomyces notabilis TaxID=2074819 RepID=A0AAN6YVS5_9PEZI|nr:hypothetical protein N656DRAFT_842683 [Canariomyces arenarius]